MKISHEPPIVTSRDTPTSHLLHSTFKESPVADYAPYPPTPIADAAYLLNRLHLHVYSMIHYQGKSNWFMQRSTIDERLFFIVKGRCTLQIAGETFTVEQGDYIHLRRGIPHYAITDPQAPLDFISLRYNATLFESLLLDDIFPLPYYIRPQGGPSLRALWEEGTRIYALQPAGWQHNLNALGLCLILGVLREHGISSQAHWQSSRIGDLQRLAPALQTIQQNLPDPPLIPELARLCNLSKEQFRRIFRRTLGTSPALYYRRIRIENACRLLLYTDETVEAIATRIGYYQVSSFVHTFKQFTGVTPGQYRRHAQDR